MANMTRYVISQIRKILLQLHFQSSIYLTIFTVVDTSYRK